METSPRMPRSRVDQLVVQELPGEVLVYDLESHKAHCLNETASFVWRRCDGETTMEAVASALHDEKGLPADEEIVRIAITQLGKAKLVDLPKNSRIDANRRQALKRIGLVGGAAAMLPLITSIVAPTAVSAATCTPTGGGCTIAATCCNKLCRKNNKCA